MRGHVHQRCGCPTMRNATGALIKDSAGKAIKDHRPGCKPTWSCVFDVGRVNGKRKQQTKGGFRTRREAERYLRETMEAVESGAFVPTGRLLVGDYLREWLASRPSLRPTTRRAYESHLRLYLIPALGSVRLDDLRASHVDRLFTDLASRTPALSATTLHRIKATLRSALNDAVRKNMLKSNPARFVDLPSLVRPELNVWTLAELHRFLTFVEDDRLGTLFRLVAMTGLRRGEVAGLQWRDVDLWTGNLIVRRQLTQVGQIVMESEPKTKAGRRTVPLDQQTVEILRDHNVTQGAELALIGLEQSPSTPVFTKLDGSSLLPESINKRFQTLAKAAGVPVIRLHDLRHTHASHALAARVDLKVVQKRLGHSSIALTADTYTHVLPELHAEAAEMVARLLGAAGAALADGEHRLDGDHHDADTDVANVQVRLSGPPGDRTLNPRIKSPLLCQLS